jgi:copper(I)-binding protein
MTPIRRELTIFFLATAISTSLVADGVLEIDDAWIAEAPPVSKVLAAYMEIENESSQDRQAVALQCEAFERAEFHRSIEKDGIARMEHLDVLEIAANSELELKPGGYHIMLFNPARPMRAGDRTACNMAFDNGASLRFELEVRKASSGDHSHHHHH